MNNVKIVDPVNASRFVDDEGYDSPIVPNLKDIVPLRGEDYEITEVTKHSDGEFIVRVKLKPRPYGTSG